MDNNRYDIESLPSMYLFDPLEKEYCRLYRNHYFVFCKEESIYRGLL